MTSPLGSDIHFKCKSTITKPLLLSWLEVLFDKQDSKTALKATLSTRQNVTMAIMVLSSGQLKLHISITTGCAWNLHVCVCVAEQKEEWRMGGWGWERVFEQINAWSSFSNFYSMACDGAHVRAYLRHAVWLPSLGRNGARLQQFYKHIFLQQQPAGKRGKLGKQWRGCP